MKNKILLTLVLCTISIINNSAFSQDTSREKLYQTEQFSLKPIEKKAQKKEGYQKIKFDGTFQFDNLNGIKPLINREILDFVNQNRLENEDLTIKFSDNVLIYIPSKSKISSKEFELLKPYRYD
jgi:hypothetical protein